MKTYDLFRMVANEMYQGWLCETYPKPSIILICIEDFCDENGNVHTGIMKTAFS